MISQYLLGHKAEVTDGEKIWYIAEHIGFLMEVDLFSGKLRAIWKIPGSIDVCAYRVLFYYDHKLYIFPFYQELVYVYNLYTAKYEKIKVKKNLEVMGVVKRDFFLYAFGDKSEILKYNLENNTITYIDMQEYVCKLKGIPLNWFWTRAFVLDERIYIPVSNSNILIVLDRYDNVSSVCLGNELENWRLANIYADGERYHVICCMGEENNIRTYILEYDLNGRLLLKKHVVDRYFYQVYPFVNAIWNGHKWICLPYGRNEIFLRDEEHDEILFEIDKGTDFFSDIIQGLFFCSVCVNGDMIFSINQSTGSLICIDSGDLTVDHLYLKVDDNFYQHYLIKKSYGDAVRFRSVIKETNNFYNLNSYINYIISE